MPSTYSTNLALELIGTGDQAGVWGNTTNTNLGTLIEQAISGYVTQAVATGTDTTITIPNGATGVARNMYIELTGTGGASTNLIVPSNKKLYFIFNNSTGAVTVKVSGQTGVSVPNGKKVVLVSNGTDIVNGLNYIADFGTNSFTVTNLTATSATITTLTGTSAGITTISSGSANITQLQSTSATITTLTGTSANIATLSGTTATFTSATVTNLALTSVTLSNLNIASANITTLTSSSATISTTLALSGGTANGVLYLNGSKVATSGSALTFDGTTLANINSDGTGFSTQSAASNFSIMRFGTDSVNGYAFFQSGKSGTGTTLPFAWRQDSSELMRLTSTGLGIGTSSPGAKLEVNTSGNGDGLWLRNSTTNMARLYRGTSGTNPGVLDLYASDVIRVKIDGEVGAVSYFNAGNVGIGTSSPNYLMTMYKASLPILQIANSTSGSGASDGLLMYLNGANATLSNEESGYLRFQTAGTERAVIDSSGNLGIGTSSPAYKLDVAGAINSSADVISQGNDARISLYRSAGINYFDWASGQSLYFSTQTSAGGAGRSTKMVLTDGGNLGIGTSSPSKRLDVRTSASGEAAVATFSNDSSAAGVNVASLEFASSGIAKASIAAAVFNEGWMSFRNNDNTEKMRLTAAGNLGLGVTPSAWGLGKAIEVGNAGNSIWGVQANDIRVGANMYYDGSVYKYINATTAAWFGVNAGGFGGFSWNINNNSPSAGGTATFTQAMTLDGSGNLLVGTTSTSLGNLNGTISYGGADAGIIYLLRQTGTDQLRFYVGGNRLGYLNTASSTVTLGTANYPLAFATNDTERARITSGGELGVGTTSPVANTPLTLQGGSGYTDTLWLKSAGTNIDSRINIAPTGTGLAQINNANGTAIAFQVSGGEKARITSGGYFKASNDGTYVGSTAAYHEFRQTANERGIYLSATNASFTSSALVIDCSRNTTDGTFTAIQYYNTGAGANKFLVYDSGNVVNTNGSYGTISDAKMKTDIVDAGSQWDDIKAVRFRKFKMKDDPSGLTQLGVVAQELEQVSPGLVSENPDRDAEGNDLGTTTKSVKTSVLLIKAAVALQEAMARIEKLEAEMAALKGA